jgi:hypothetical protein
MKTPKEKAEELIRKYYTWGINKEGQTLSWLEAKQCALIAVDEAEKSEYNVLKKFGFVTENYKSDYWQEVKIEIENYNA